MPDRTHSVVEDFPRPIGLVDAIRIAGRLYTGSFKRFLIPTLLVYALVIELRTIGVLPVEDPQGGARIGLATLAVVLALMGPVIARSFLFAGLSRTFEGALDGDPLPPETGLRGLRGRWRDIAAIGALVATVVAALTFLTGEFVVVLSPPLWGPLIFIQVIALEELGLRDALARGRVLLAGHWARLFLYLISVGVGLGVAGATILGGVYEIASGWLTPLGAELVIYWLNPVIAALGEPFLAALGVVLYHDLRARRGEVPEPGAEAEPARAPR